jgi:hypothetical protein
MDRTQSMLAQVLRTLLIVAVLLAGRGAFLVEVQARTPTPMEMEAIHVETQKAFEEFLQLWQEERYFEMYEFGRRQSKELLGLEEYATRMVELDWVPVQLAPEKPPVVSFRFQTMLYVEATIVFRHKSMVDLQFERSQAFLLLKEDGKWRFDLLQMIRSPFYVPVASNP